jgi:hypothetical protein
MADESDDDLARLIAAFGETVEITASVGLDRGECEEVGMLRINVAALFGAVWPYAKSDASQRIAGALGDRSKLKDRLRLWLTGLTLHERTVSGLGANQLAEWILEQDEPTLRSTLGAGPVAMALCGRFGLRWSSGVAEREALGRALLNQPRPGGGRPQRVYNLALVRIEVQRMEDLLAPLAVELQSDASTALARFAATLAHDDLWVIGSIVQHQLNERWTTWTPHIDVANAKQRPRRKVLTPRALACDLVAAMYGVAPSTIEGMSGSKPRARKPA